MRLTLWLAKSCCLWQHGIEYLKVAASLQNNRLLFVHPGCPPFAQHAAKAFFDAGMLSAYVTTFAYQPERKLGQYLAKGFSLFSERGEKELARRRITSVPDEFVITHPLREVVRTLTSKSKLGPIAADYVWERAELWFDKQVSRNHLKESQAVYGYEHSVLETFSAQRDLGALNIYDMPTAHHKVKSAILDAEYLAFPEVQTNYSKHVTRQKSRRNRRTDQELALADLVICPSKFVKDSLIAAGATPDAVVVIPFGSPEVSEPPVRKLKPLIFLSAGNQSITKGTHYLLEAWRKLKPTFEYELWLVGKMSLPEHLLKDLPANVVLKDSVPRAELFDIYRRASVLVLPTLFEGFALVITEAMAHGLTVITTPNSGAEGFINDGEEGHIVPMGNADKLAEAIERCIDNSDEVEAMSQRAYVKAASWQWSNYRLALAGVISKFLESKAA